MRLYRGLAFILPVLAVLFISFAVVAEDEPAPDAGGGDSGGSSGGGGATKQEQRLNDANAKKAKEAEDREAADNEKQLRREKAVRERRRKSEDARKARSRKVTDAVKRGSFVSKAADSESDASAGAADDEEQPADAASGEAPAHTNPDDLLDGYYVGESDGHDGKIRVAVRVSNGKIRQIKVLAEDETKPRGAFSSLERAMKKENSSAVDAVSGATDTSKGFTGAVEAALASKKPLKSAPARTKSFENRKSSRKKDKDGEAGDADIKKSGKKGSGKKADANDGGEPESGSGNAEEAEVQE